jgi:hypothetical protein
MVPNWLSQFTTTGNQIAIHFWIGVHVLGNKSFIRTKLMLSNWRVHTPTSQAIEDAALEVQVNREKEPLSPMTKWLIPQLMHNNINKNNQP